MKKSKWICRKLRGYLFSRFTKYLSTKSSKFFSLKIISPTVLYILLQLLHHNILLGVQQSIQYPVSTPVTINTQSLLSSDQQHHSMSPSE